MDTDDKIKIGVSIVVVLLVLFIIVKILGKVGLIKSKDKQERIEAVNDLRSMKEFEPSYWRNHVAANLGKSVADQYAKELHKAKGLFNDNEELVYSTFSKFKNKSNISEVAESFYNKYKTDLRSYILGFLNNKQKQNLFNLISNLTTF